MKTLKTNLLLFFVAFIGLSLTSCEKDKDQGPASGDNIVGEWVVTKAVGTAYESGNLVGTSELPATGGVTFHADGTGEALFTIEIDEDEFPFVGPFTWEDQGFEVVWDEGTEDEVRWVQDEDEPNRQVLRVTERPEGNPDLEAELTITLVRS